MKRYGHIFDKITTIENIEKAHEFARKDKTYYNEVKMVDNNKEYYFKQIQDMLKNKIYTVKPEDYKMFIKVDKGKEREIYKLDYFPHRIIQWALILQIEEILHKNLISNTFSSIPERGIHLALKKMDSDIQNDIGGTKYCLKMDIKKFYPNINQEIVKQLFRRKFKDKDLLWLIDMIVNSMGGETGVAIGSLFSQWVGNFYLSPFDHWLKEVKGVKYYYRYCDDLVILHNDKEFLHKLMADIKLYLKDNLDLEIKDDYQVFPREIRGIDFVGYRHFGSYILLRKSTAKNLKAKMSKLLKRCKKGIPITYGEWCSVNSYKGWLKWCNAYNLYNSHIKPLEPYCDKYYKEVIKGENISKC